jgi:hypothetical protein
MAHLLDVDTKRKSMDIKKQYAQIKAKYKVCNLSACTAYAIALGRLATLF